MEKLLTAIFKESCYFCKSPGRLICHACESKLKLCSSGVCIACQKETVLGATHVLCHQKSDQLLPSQLSCIYEYGGLVAEIIKKSKYNPKTFALLRLLSSSGSALASKIGFDYSGYIVVPIPISRQRERDRGFNQGEIIAKAVCREFGLPMDNSILVRTRDTNKQFGLHRQQRSQNLTGAFSVKKEVKGRKILLVDDICTTGATLLEAATMLLIAEASQVCCFTLSRKG